MLKSHVFCRLVGVDFSRVVFGHVGEEAGRERRGHRPGHSRAHFDHRERRFLVHVNGSDGQDGRRGVVSVANLEEIWWKKAASGRRKFTSVQLKMILSFIITQ